MARISRKRKEALELLEPGKQYSLAEAAQLVKDTTKSKFDGSVDIAIRLGVDPRKAVA